MNTEQIRELARLLEDYGLTGISVKEGDFSVRLEKKPAPLVTGALQPAGGEGAGDTSTYESEKEQTSGLVVTSPMVGVFYTSPAPDAEPFVTPGSRVEPGDVLCIIEAMKLMNEITAEHKGVIRQVLAENGQVVEAGEPLFRMEIEK